MYGPEKLSSVVVVVGGGRAGARAPDVAEHAGAPADIRTRQATVADKISLKNIHFLFVLAGVCAGDVAERGGAPVDVRTREASVKSQPQK